MKIKKLLPLVLLAVTAVLMLSSCDAMLDAIFPSNQITVDVGVSKNTNPGYYTDWYNAYYYNVNYSTVTLTLFDITTGTSITQSGSWSDIGAVYVHYVFLFTNLKDHLYALTATYHSYGDSSNATTSSFYDPTGYFSSNPIQLPFKNSHDSTGHSVDLQMHF